MKTNRRVHIGLGLAVLVALAAPLSTASADETSAIVVAEDEVQAAATSGWSRVYRNDFTNLTGVNAFQSASAVNSGIKASDSDNSSLQKPSLKSNVQVVDDRAAGDGKSMAVYTRRGTYATAAGNATGWTNGRMALTGQNEAPPVRIRTRLKMTASVQAKSAVMWWPASGGWPWEVDFAETFGGQTLTDYWGGRQNVTQRWHGDVNGDGSAVEQLAHDDKVDATVYHVYDLFVTPDRMWVEIDGTKTFETTDKRFIPTGDGFFTIGKALTGRRDAANRTDDAVVVDYVEIYKPGVGTDPAPDPEPVEPGTYYANAYSSTIYKVAASGRTAVTYEQWAAAGFPAPRATNTDYVKYAWASPIYAVTYWAAGWQWDKLDYQQWARAGHPTPRNAGWIDGSSIHQRAGSSELVLTDPEGGTHVLTYAEWSDTGFHAFTTG